MGKNSSLLITENQARRIFDEYVSAHSDVTTSLGEIEKFFDTVLDKDCYNVVFVSEHEIEEGSRKTDYAIVESAVERFVQSHPDVKPTSVVDENRLLRQLLALRVAGTSLYRDDGEWQDNSEAPFIDFMRDSAEEIRRKLIARGEAKLQNIRTLFEAG